MFARVLIANRGEIAIRVCRTLRRLGIESVALYAPQDRAALHPRAADRALALEPRTDRSPYLDVEQIVALAVRCGADAVHPGYGFLAESAAAATAFGDAGVRWIGPTAQAIALLGDKLAAKRVASAAGVPVIPGQEVDEGAASVERLAERVGYPLLVKATAGGGGRGMRRVDSLDEVPGALEAARREALAAFGRGELLVERLVEPARHLEVQIALDDHGGALSLGERECSLQRRHQKLIEESPSPAVGEELRERLAQAALVVAGAAGYRNLGTVEFIAAHADPSDFAFLEMNARLQVEHPVTEAVTGLDLVELQLRLAAGEPLPARGRRPARGHAIEARVCAERPAAGFLPSTGRVLAYRPAADPQGPRVDSGIGPGSEIGPAFDSLLLKVVAHGQDREQALALLDRSLGELVLLGVETNVDHLRRLLADPRVRAGDTTTGLVEALPAPDRAAARERAAIAAAAAVHAQAARAAGGGAFSLADGWRLAGPAATVLRLRAGEDEGAPIELRATPAAGGLRVAVDGGAERRVAILASTDEEVEVAVDGGERERWAYARDPGALWLAGPAGNHRFPLRDEAPAAATLRGSLQAPLPGVVIALRAVPGQQVAAGDPLLVIESMKTELEISAPHAGVLTTLAVLVGEHVARGQVLAAIEPGEGVAA